MPARDEARTLQGTDSFTCLPDLQKSHELLLLQVIMIQTRIREKEEKKNRKKDDTSKSRGDHILGLHCLFVRPHFERAPGILLSVP